MHTTRINSTIIGVEWIRSVPVMTDVFWTTSSTVVAYTLPFCFGLGTYLFACPLNWPSSASYNCLAPTVAKPANLWLHCYPHRQLWPAGPTTDHQSSAADHSYVVALRLVVEAYRSGHCYSVGCPYCCWCWYWGLYCCCYRYWVSLLLLLLSLWPSSPTATYSYVFLWHWEHTNNSWWGPSYYDGRDWKV